MRRNCANSATGQFVGSLVGIFSPSNVYATEISAHRPPATSAASSARQTQRRVRSPARPYSTGSVTASGAQTSSSAALLSTADTIISNSYSTGAVTGGSHHGGFVGKVQTG
jgi:hypothetical protein